MSFTCHKKSSSRWWPSGFHRLHHLHKQSRDREALRSCGTDQEAAGVIVLPMVVVKITGQIRTGASCLGSCCKGMSNFVLSNRFQRHSWNINMALLKRILSATDEISMQHLWLWKPVYQWPKGPSVESIPKDSHFVVLRQVKVRCLHLVIPASTWLIRLMEEILMCKL